MTPLIIFSKLWFLVLLMINTRFIFIGIGFLIGGVATLESSLIASFMVEAQEVYTDVAEAILGYGSSVAPSLNDESIEQLINESSDKYEQSHQMFRR